MTAPSPTPDTPQRPHGSAQVPSPTAGQSATTTTMPVVPPPPGGGPSRPSTVAGPPRRSPGVLLAIVIASLSLLVALGSAAFAWRAIDQAQDARDIALAGGGGAAPAAGAGAQPAQPPAAAPATEAAAPPADPASTEPPPLDINTVFTEKYPKQALTLTVQTCRDLSVDLDEPRVNADSGADLILNGACSGAPATFGLAEDVDGSAAGAPGMTPGGCAEKIRTAPVTGIGIPVRQGTVVCLQTSFPYARSHGDPWRIVLVEVTGVGNDGTVTVQASAWNIPG